MALFKHQWKSFENDEKLRQTIYSFACEEYVQKGNEYKEPKLLRTDLKSGMRRNEILALQKKDIDLEKKIVPITPHYFRHNFTTDLIYAGVPLKTVQTIMGHENIQTTMDIYTDVRYDNNEVIEKLDNYLK